MKSWISPGPERRGYLLPALLLALAAIALLLRVVSVAEPLGIDQGLWASAVRGMAGGQTLYVDVWEQRPPGIYLTYLAGFWLFGWSAAAVAWLDIVAAAVTTWLLWHIGRRLATPVTGALAAAMFALLTMPAGLYGYGGFLERSVCETFIVVCVGFTAVGVARERTDRGRAPVWALVAGLFGGAAALYKPNAGLYLPALMLWWFASVPASRRVLRQMAPAIGLMVLGAALPIVLTVVWLWQADALGEARVAVVDFNRYYVTEGLATPAHAMAFVRAVWFRIKTEPVWAAGCVASLVAVWTLLRTRALPALPALALCWGAAATVVILVNGARLFNSYFLQASAPLCLMAAWWLADRRAAPRRMLVARLVVAALMVVQLGSGPYLVRAAERTGADWYRLTGQTGQAEYLDDFGGYDNNRGYSARANRQLADYLQDHTTDRDQIFLFGVNAADVYFLSGRLTAHRFLRVNFFYPPGFPHPAFTVEAVARDLAVRRPRYLVFEDLHASSAIGRAVSGIRTDPAVETLLEGYEVETTIEDFTIYRLRAPAVPNGVG